MSSTTLTTYIRTPGRDVPAKPIPLPSVAVPKGLKFSSDPSVLTMLYGTRDTIEELSRVHQVADLEGERVHRCNVKVDIGYWQAGPIGMIELAKTQFLNLQRVKLDVAEAMLDAVKTNLKRGEARYRELMKKDGIDVIRANPFLLDRMRADDRFSHVSVIAYDARGDDRAVRLAHLYSNAEITELDVRSTRPIEFVLPKGFSTESLRQPA